MEHATHQQKTSERLPTRPSFCIGAPGPHRCVLVVVQNTRRFEMHVRSTWRRLTVVALVDGGAVTGASLASQAGCIEGSERP